MTSPLHSYSFDETAPKSRTRAKEPAQIVTGLIYAGVLLILVGRVVLQAMG